MVEAVLLIAIVVLVPDDGIIYGYNWVIKKRGIMSPEILLPG
jgi:hypothetical protein